MFETECRGCIHAKAIGYFLYCIVKGMQPAKEKCNLFSTSVQEKKPSNIEDWGK